MLDLWLKSAYVRHMLDFVLKISICDTGFCLICFVLSWHWIYDFNFKEHSTYLQSRSFAVVRPLFRRPTWIPTRWKIHPVLIFHFYRRLSQKLSCTWCSFEYKSSKFQPPHVHIFVCPLTYHADHTTRTTNQISVWSESSRLIREQNLSAFDTIGHSTLLSLLEQDFDAPGLAGSNHICPSLFLQIAELLQAPEAWVWDATRVSTCTVTKRCYLH